MALPEDDVEEIDPGAVAGPDPRPRPRRDRRRARAAAGPRDRRARPRSCSRSRRRRRRADRPRRRGAPLARDAGALVGGRPPAGGPDAAHRRVRAAPGGQRPRARRRRRPRRRRRRRAPRRPGTRPTTWGQVVVLKGAKTVIAAPDGSVAIAPFENPALASGGTGDVLSGTIGSLLAQGLEPFAAARLGVYLHGLAGDAVRERFGDAGLLASDLPEAIAIARKRLAADRRAKATGGRLGFGRASRDGGRRRRTAPATDRTDRGARSPRADARTPPDPAARSRTASPRPGCRRCHGRPGSRSTSTRSPATSP